MASPHLAPPALCLDAFLHTLQARAVTACTGVGLRGSAVTGWPAEKPAQLLLGMT